MATPLICPKCKGIIQQKDTACPFCHSELDKTIVETHISNSPSVPAEKDDIQNEVNSTEATVLTSSFLDNVAHAADKDATIVSEEKEDDFTKEHKEKRDDLAKEHKEKRDELAKEEEDSPDTFSETRKQESGIIGKKFGRCKVMEKIGQGGMGSVYKAYHQTLDQYVVLKALPVSLAMSQEFRERFIREARSCAKLYHQNVVQVLDAGYENGIYFYLMEFVDGDSLESMLSKGKQFSCVEACQIIRDTAIGLEVAHKQGIIHRDIKPSNIMITKSGIVKVADFGLACDLRSERISLPGQMMGTPQYMSPEQWDGIDVDARSDLYSLGITFYHLLAGTVPFKGATPISILKKHAMEKPQPLRNMRADIPAAVERIVLKMIEKEKENRYPDTRAVITDLDKFLNNSSSIASTTSGNKKVYVLVSTFLLLAVIFVAGFLWQNEIKKALGLSPVEVKPVEVKPGETKPVEIKPGETKPVEIKPGETKPVEIKPGETKPAEIKPGETKPVEIKPGETKPVEIKPGETKPVEVKPGETKPVEVKPVEVIQPLPTPQWTMKDVGNVVRTLPFNLEGEIAEPLPPHAQISVLVKHEVSGETVSKLVAECKEQKFSAALTSLSEGKYRLIPVATRKKSKEKKEGAAFSISLDLTPPKINLKSPQDKVILYEEKDGKKIKMELDCSDTVSGIQSVTVSVRQDTIPASSGGKSSYHVSLPLSWGKQKYQIVAVDYAGHKSTLDGSLSLVPAGMVRVPGGTYVFQEKTAVVKPFYIDRTEVTNDAYQQYLQASSAASPMRWPSPKDRTDYWKRLPVVFVSHKDAVLYSQFLGKRLPTEAEWIVAALANKEQINDYPWGNRIDDVEWPQQLQPVGTWTLDQSPSGVRDMAGNVSEWTSDVREDEAMRKGGYYVLRQTMLKRFKWASVNFWEKRESCNNWLGFRCAFSEEQE